MLLNIDGTFIAQMLNFVVFWLLLNYVFIAPTRRAIEERMRLIDEQHSQAQALRARAAALKAEADALFDVSRRRTDEIMREAAARAAAEAHEIERKSNDDATASVTLAHAQVASERSQAVEKQAALVDDLARAMVKRAVDLEGAA